MVRSCFLTDPRKGGSGEREKGKGVEEFVVESVHWDEGQTLRLLKNWVFERLAVFDPYRSHLERRFSFFLFFFFLFFFFLFFLCDLCDLIFIHFISFSTRLSFSFSYLLSSFLSLSLSPNRDFKVHGTTYLPVYHFSVRYSVSKEWMVLSSQKQSVFVPHHEVFPEERGCFYGCGGSLEEERRVFLIHFYSFKFFLSFFL